MAGAAWMQCWRENAHRLVRFGRADYRTGIRRWMVLPARNDRNDFGQTSLPGGAPQPLNLGPAPTGRVVGMITRVR